MVTIPFVQSSFASTIWAWQSDFSYQAFKESVPDKFPEVLQTGHVVIFALQVSHA